jgi:hypothetical protein
VITGARCRLCSKSKITYSSIAKVSLFIVHCIAFKTRDKNMAESGYEVVKFPSLSFPVLFRRPDKESGGGGRCN